MENVVVNRMTANERRVVGYTSAAHGLNHAVELVYGAVLAVIGLHFGVSLVFLGLIANVTSLTYAFSALPAGDASDRLGSKRVVVLSMAGSGVFGLLAAASPNIWVLAVSLGAMGIMAGMYHPSGLSFISRSVQQRTRGLAYHGMGGSLGTAVAPAVAALLAGIYSWRASFAVFALLNVAIALLVQFSSVSEDTPGSGETSEKTDAAPPSTRSRAVPLTLVFMLNGFFGFIFRGTVVFLPLHLSRRLGFDFFGLEPVVIGGSFATVALLFGIAGQYLGGELGHRYKRQVVVIPLTLLSMLAMVLVGASTGIALLAAASAFVLFNFMAAPSYNALIADFASDRFHGRAYGFTSLAIFGVGSFAGGLGGVIAENHGTEWVFIMMAGVGGIVAALAYVLYLYIRAPPEVIAN